MCIKFAVLILSFSFWVVKCPSQFTATEEQDLFPPETRPVLKSQGEGSPSGNVFDDVASINADILNVRRISIASMYQVDYLQLNYQLVNGSIYCAPDHGDEVLFWPENFTLASDEYIERIEGSTNYEKVNQLTFTINRPNLHQRRVLGPYGTTVGKRNFTFDGYVLGFFGKTGQLLQNVGVYYLVPVKTSQTFGNLTQTFTEHPDGLFPPVIKVTKILIHHSIRINSLQFEYLLLNGKTRLGNRNGGIGGYLSVIKFQRGNRLIGIEGRMSSSGSFDTVSQLTFVCMEKGKIKKYGPFGKFGTGNFSVNGNIVGYSGSASKLHIGALQFFFYN